MKKQLSKDSKEQLAVALIMLKDWKSQNVDFSGKIEVIEYIANLAAAIGVSQEFNDFIGKLSFKVTPQ